MTYYVYILQSELDGSFYIGFTYDLKTKPGYLNTITVVLGIHPINDHGNLSTKKNMFRKQQQSREKNFLKNRKIVIFIND